MRLWSTVLICIFFSGFSFAAYLEVLSICITIMDMSVCVSLLLSRVKIHKTQKCSSMVVVELGSDHFKVAWRWDGFLR